MIYLERVSKGALDPVKATTHAACFDVCADMKERAIKTWYDNNRKRSLNGLEGVTLRPGERALIPTGWKMRCAPGFRIAIYPRSGLAIKNGITLANCVGVIDADYSDEVFIAVINTSAERFTIKQGHRIAQIALERIEPCNMVIVGELPAVDSNRDGGLGSTGVE